MTHDAGSDPTGQTDFRNLLALCRTLRGPDGCPWDRAQTVRTLTRFLVEESFEVLYAAERSDTFKVAAELGDLAFVLALTLVTAESEGMGPPEAGLSHAAEKIRRRHPHVFSEPADLSEAELWRQWEASKQAESGGVAPGGHLPSPDPALPALLQARKFQERAATVGFDWPRVQPVIAKLREELDELEEAMTSGVGQREELGDLLFATVNLARFLDFDPEATLREANSKFRRRFNALVDRVHAEDRRPEELSLAELDAHWDAVKEIEKNNHGQ